MPGTGVGLAPDIRTRGDYFVFVTGERPDLPAFQPIAAPRMDERIYVIVRDHVSFPALDVNGQHDKIDLVAEEPVLQMTIKRNHRRVILLRNGRALLEIKRKQSEPADVGFRLSAAAGKAQELENVESILRAEPVISDHRVGKIKFCK